MVPGIPDISSADVHADARPCSVGCVVQGVEGMAEQLRGVLANPRTTAPEAAAPMRLLLQLQADGAATVQPLNPVKLYLDTQVQLDAKMETPSQAARHSHPKHAVAHM